MNGPNENQRNYKWPWVVLAAVIVGIVVSVIWVAIAVKKVEQERDVNGPLHSTAPTPGR